MSIIISDMDGCLSRSRTQASGQMIGSIKRIMESHEFVIISGGDIKLIEKQVGKFFYNSEKPIHLLSQNGCYYYTISTKGLECIYKEELSPDEKGRIFKMINNLIHTFFIDPITDFDDMIDDRGGLINFSATGRNAPLRQKEQFDPDKSKRKIWLKKAQNELPDLQVTIGGTSSLDFTKRGRHKGYGIEKFLEYMKWHKNNAIFIGDAIFEGGNDFEAAQLIKESYMVENPAQCLEVLEKWQ